jgi:uncharacterized protein (TIGR00304 family)
MNNIRFLSIISLIGGLAFFILGASNNEIQVGFFLIFPFIVGSGIYSFLGFCLIFLFIVLLLYNFISLNETSINNQIAIEEITSPKKKLKVSGIVFLGPIPLIFGTNCKKALLFIIIVYLILSIILFILFI